MEHEELGALFARITRRLVDAERPLLAAHDLSMWDYIALSYLAQRPAESQLALAQAIGYDKTRLIGLLDDLQKRGLVTRDPDPADRRARTVRLTPAGQKMHGAARADIAEMEKDVLVSFSAAERRALRATLSRLADEPRP